MEETGSFSDGRAMLSKPLIQFSVHVWSCVPSLLVIRGQGEVPGHSQASLGQSLVGPLLLSPGSIQGFVCTL